MSLATFRPNLHRRPDQICRNLPNRRQTIWWPKPRRRAPHRQNGSRARPFFPDTTNTQSVGLSLSIPLFTGGKNYYGFQSTSALASAADLQRENVLREQRRKLEAAWASYLEANLKLKADESFQKASVVRAEIARTRYNNGLLSFEDWDVIENDLIIRQRTILNTKRDRVSAEAAWEQAQGTGVWK